MPYVVLLFHIMPVSTVAQYVHSRRIIF